MRANASSVDEITVEDVPMNIALDFQGVAARINTLPLLEISGEVSQYCKSTGGSYKPFHAQFRDVPVYRK
jgi:hypothetical protein